MRPVWRNVLAVALAPGCIVAVLGTIAGLAALAAVALRLVGRLFGGP